MKKISLAIVLFFASFITYAQPADQQEAMKSWMEYMTPGKMHQWMAQMDGKWKTDLSVWMAPGADAMKSTGVNENTMLLDGRYQQIHQKGEVMGMPFEGYGTLAFDNAKKTFYMSWIDNMGTGLMYLSGTMDEATKTLTLKGSAYDATTKKDMNYKQVMKFIDKDHYTMEMYVDADGTEMKSMEIQYTRM